MKTLMTGLGASRMSEGALANADGFSVAYCGVCRTDAKMYYEGQRDLSLPRVLGHEVVFRRNADDRHFVAWPAKSCSSCAYCASGRENLCDDIRIMGFHFDGGYDSGCSTEGLELVETGSSPAFLYVFAEPLGCALNALANIPAEEGLSLLVVGGGTLGLIAGMVGKKRGMAVTLLERNEEKIMAVSGICEKLGVRIAKSTDAGSFDWCINACADPAAFASSLGKLKKGGGYIFFSGLSKNETLGTNLLNLVHYRELRIFGAYGLTRAGLTAALAIIDEEPAFFESLIQDFVDLGDAPKVFSEVMAGTPLKYIIDFTGASVLRNRKPSSTEARCEQEKGIIMETKASFTPPAIPSIDEALKARACFVIDNKTKPLGSLGKIEELAIRLCAIQNTLSPRVAGKLMLVFASDHGVTEEGVSAFPQEVTAQMVKNFMSGKAAINVMCRQFGIDLHVVDMGVNADLDYNDMVIGRKVRKGTRNFAVTDAMTEGELVSALSNGMDAFEKYHDLSPVEVLGLGEMGIGNSSSAALIVSMITGIPVEETVGRGTGVDDEGLKRKIEVLKKARHLHSAAAPADGRQADGLAVLRKVGGYEIAGMVGAALAAAAKRIPVVLDGVISTAAGLVACSICPQVKDYLIVGHKSVEKAQAAACAWMGIDPVLDLTMRLGEGTGAALAISVLETASRIVNEMASFEEAHVSEKTKG